MFRSSVFLLNRLVKYSLDTRLALDLHPRRYAGHSHWQNVRHTKEANDREKNRINQFYVRAISRAIKDGGGIRDPKLNSRLGSVIAEAKVNSVPLATIERVIKDDPFGDPFIVEVQAQGGLFVLIQSIAKRMHSERSQIASVIKRFGCSVSQTPGVICNEFFDHVGVVTVKGGADTKINDLNAALDIGCDIGAHDVLVSDDDTNYMFYCQPNKLNDLCNRIANDFQLEIIEAEDVYLPKHPVIVTSEVYDNLQKMYDGIRQNSECVQKIFDNVSLNEMASKT